MSGIIPHVSTEKLDELKNRLEEISKLTPEFLVLLSSSTLLASLGLFQNSPAVIIGAMIVAPLMRPLVSLSLAVVTADTKLFSRATVTLLIGTACGILLSFAMGWALSFLTVTPEITNRTHPNLLDLGVAIVAGAVGAYCQTNSKLADSLAGVAIAVALVPPLSVVGIGIALSSYSIWSGALLLYATNLIGITFAGSIVFFLHGYTPLKQARKGLLISFSTVVLLIAPLAFSMRELILENILSSNIQEILQRTETFKGMQLQNVDVKLFRKPMDVKATVLSSNHAISSNQVKLVQDHLEKETGRSVSFKLRMIPATEISSVEVSPQGEVRQFEPLSPSIPSFETPIIDHGIGAQKKWN